jgi:cold shock CspA family protein
LALEATVVMWREREGWGFLKPDTKPFNLFVGRWEIKGEKPIMVGARVSCDLVKDKRGNRAKNVVVL